MKHCLPCNHNHDDNSYYLDNLYVMFVVVIENKEEATGERRVCECDVLNIFKALETFPSLENV